MGMWKNLFLIVCYSVCGLITETFGACEILQKLNQIMYKEEAYFSAICSLISGVFFLFNYASGRALGMAVWLNWAAMLFHHSGPDSETYITIGWTATKKLKTYPWLSEGQFWLLWPPQTFCLVPRVHDQIIARTKFSLTWAILNINCMLCQLVNVSMLFQLVIPAQKLLRNIIQTI